VSDLAAVSGDLASVSNLAATVFADLTEALDAVLGLAQELLGMGTIFVASADQEAGVQKIIAVRVGAHGCGLAPGAEIPLHQAV
jgi:hypothetical protein